MIRRSPPVTENKACFVHQRKAIIEPNSLSSASNLLKDSSSPVGIPRRSSRAASSPVAPAATALVEDRKPKVRMKAKAHRDRPAGSGNQGCLHGEAIGAERRRHLKAVAEREKP